MNHENNLFTFLFLFYSLDAAKVQKVAEPAK